MKKSFIFGAAMMLACSFGLQSCDKESNPTKPQEPTEEVIDDGTELADFVAKYAKDGVVTLPAGVEFVMSSALTVAEPLTIAGADPTKPSTIVITPAEGEEISNAFIVSKGITLQNLTIDATNVKKAFIAMAEEPVIEANEKSAYITESIKLDNVAIANLKGSIFWDGNKKYGVPYFSITKSFIMLNTDTKAVNNEALIAFQGGGAKDFAIETSTVFNVSETGAKYFLRYSNNGRIDNLGYNKETEQQTWSYLNNTFYKVIDNNNGQWGNGPNGQKYFNYMIGNNIWVDCSKDIIRRLTNGRYATEFFVIENNTYWKDGAALDESSYDKSGTALTTDPAFADPAKANFTPTGSEQVEKKTGDPRWFTSAE